MLLWKRVPVSPRDPKGCPEQTHIGWAPSCGSTGMALMFGKKAIASAPVFGLLKDPAPFVPVRRIPTRASFNRFGDSVDVKLTVRTCGRRYANVGKRNS